MRYPLSTPTAIARPWGEGSAIVGHHDRRGVPETATASSWNSSHPTRGCSVDALKSTGSGGLLYCFAAN
jgi:hypothetical protein